MHHCQKGVVHINHAFSGVHLLSAMLVVSGAGAPGWPCTKSAAVNLLAVTQEAWTRQSRALCVGMAQLG
jgi:hypothetical protein